MDAVTLLAFADAAGVTVEVVDGELFIEAPRSKKSFVADLRKHREILLAHFNGDPSTDSPEADDSEKNDTVGAPHIPFPVHTLPGAVGEFVAAASAAIGCDPSFIALPLLTCLARAIGNKRQIRLKRDWTESPIVWACIVGKSGTHKTPAMQAAMKFLQKRETEAFNAYAEAAAQFEQDIAMYDRDLAAWKKMKGSTEPAPWKPDPPACERYITCDTTIEALASLLAAQFDGILLCRDELAGWLGSFDQYKGGKGGDKAHWLSMWSGGR